MDNRVIYRLGELYHWLEDAVSPKNEYGEVAHRNMTDLRNAQRTPLAVITTKINVAHKLHVADRALNRAIANVYADITLEEMMSEIDKCLSMEQQGEFQRGYLAKNYRSDIASEVTSVREARKAAGYTIKQLAEIVGVSGVTISEIEHGYKTPKASTLKKIADACGVTMDEIWN